MFCPKCGDKNDQTEVYCNQCGNYLGINNQNNQHNNVATNNNSRKKLIGLSLGIGLFLLILTSVFLISQPKKQYYFSNDNYENNEEIAQNSNTSSSTQKKGKHSTVIVADNTYSGVKISNAEDAYDLIIQDSVSQKDNCPSNIKEIEDKIISDYGVTAVNLCEMDIDFAQEVGNVFDKIYKEYPSVRGYLTNLTLTNASLSQGYIAAFMPSFSFATSDSSSTYPWVMKTQILLNTTYFLNTARLESTVKDGSSSGHFPPNATIYSPVAHELGHYLSFIAMLKNYKSNSVLMIDENNIENYYDIYSDFVNGNFSLLMISEAYENYKKDIGTTLDIDQWRAQISNYAVAKDNNGDYIYDETIAEAFHDVYLNQENAKDVSRYVISVLQERLEG